MRRSGCSDALILHPQQEVGEHGLRCWACRGHSRGAGKGAVLLPKKVTGSPCHSSHPPLGSQRCGVGAQCLLALGEFSFGAARLEQAAPAL